MAIKTILVCLTNQTASDGLMRAATILARTHGAHLIGLHTIQAMAVYPGIAVHIPDSVFEQFNAAQSAQAEAIKTIFDRHTQTEDFVAEWRLQKNNSTKAIDRILDSARIADLILVPSHDPDLERPDQHNLQEEVIRNSGRPVLVVPQGFEGDTIGTSTLIGWNDTKPATRAAHDALTLMQDGAAAHIVRIHGDDDELDHDATLTEMAAAFARHGVTTSVGHKAWQRHAVADILEEEAVERRCDLIAIGAFGHSRVYGAIRGAATRALLKKAKRPVLFSR